MAVVSSSKNREHFKKDCPWRVKEKDLKNTQLIMHEAFDFYTNQLVNDLVGGNEEIISSANASIITGREDVKHSESNTTNHSTGDSQNSSSAEKVDTRKLLNKDQACSSGSSS